MIFDPIQKDPFFVFSQWLKEAEASEPNDPNAMCLATVDKNGKPGARMVLLKKHGTDGFTFFTNSHSRKGNDLAVNTHVALLFHWKSLLRQIRIEGRTEIVSREETTEYFHSRHRNSQIASYASDQSRPLPDKQIYLDRIATVKQQFEEYDNIPCPDHWNGYRVIPDRIEFWVQEEFRTHDRFVFTKDARDNWTCQRLYP